MKKTLGTIVLAGLLFLAGCGANALSTKSISEKLTKEPTKVSVIYVDPDSGIQRETITLQQRLHESPKVRWRCCSLLCNR